VHENCTRVAASHMQNLREFTCDWQPLRYNLKDCSYFCYSERNSEHFSLLRNGWNEIPRVCFYFCSTVENFEHFSLPRKGSERNSKSFLFRGTAEIPPEQTNCSVYSVFCGIIFLSEIANPTLVIRGLVCIKQPMHL
jgi:hypothetical protein